MIDDEHGVSAASTPVDRGARPEPQVIEGEIADKSERQPDPPPAEAKAEPPPHSGGRGFLGGALAGLIVSALALGAAIAYLTPRADSPELAKRLNAIETQTQRENAALAAGASRNVEALAGLEKRVAALAAAASGPGAADLDKRVAALEASAASGASAASDASQRLAGQDKALQADIDAERTALSDLAARVTKLETGVQKADAASAGLAALTARVDKNETALAAPKTPAASDTAAAIAIIAEAAEKRLRAGEPLGPDIAALRRLGLDGAALAPLEPVAQGAPTDAALAAAFSAVEPHVLAAVSRKETGSVADRFLAHLQGLVRVRDLNETAGDDPAALASQVQAMSRRGDIKGALASFARFPEAAQKAAGDWPTLARARQGADAALRSIRQAAIEKLASGPKP